MLIHSCFADYIIILAYCLGSDDYSCDVDKSLLSYSEQEYGYFNDLMDEEYKVHAETLCEEFRLQYPPNDHEDALLLYLVLKDDSDEIDFDH